MIRHPDDDEIDAAYRRLMMQERQDRGLRHLELVERWLPEVYAGRLSWQRYGELMRAHLEDKPVFRMIEGDDR